MTERLPDQDLDQQLQTLHQDWDMDSQRRQIERSVRLPDYDTAMWLANEIADIADQNDHHPELLINWGLCRIRYTTHSADGLTEKDFKCARAIDIVLASS